MTTDLLARKRTHFFDVLDKNADGTLAKADFVKFADALAGMRGWAPGGPEHERIRAFVMSWWERFKEAADIDDDGSISSREFAAVLDQADEESLSNVANMIFDIMDANQAGTISVDEYRQLLRALFVNEDEAEDSFSRFDTDGDGVISREEFSSLLVEYHTSDDEEAVGNSLFGRLAGT